MSEEAGLVMTLDRMFFKGPFEVCPSLLYYCIRNISFISFVELLGFNFNYDIGC